MLELLEKYNKEVKTGKSKKTRIRQNSNMSVINEGRHYCCLVIEDLYESLEGEKPVKLVQYIDKKQDYHFVEEQPI